MKCQLPSRYKESCNNTNPSTNNVLQKLKRNCSFYPKAKVTKISYQGIPTLLGLSYAIVFLGASSEPTPEASSFVWPIPLEGSLFWKDKALISYLGKLSLYEKTIPYLTMGASPLEKYLIIRLVNKESVLLGQGHPSFHLMTTPKDSLKEGHVPATFGIHHVFHQRQASC